MSDEAESSVEEEQESSQGDQDQSGTPDEGPFRHRRYSIRRPFWSWTGRTFFIHGSAGKLLFVVNHPFWRFREEIVIYRDEAQQQPVLRMRESKIIAADVRYDVTAAPGANLVGAIVSRGVKSIARDAWDILGSDGKHLGMMQEGGRALLRRFVPILKGIYHIEVGGEEVATVTQVAGTFSKEYSLEILPGDHIDTRLAIACAVLAVINEPASS